MAMCMTDGLLLDYTALVEKKHMGSLSLAKKNSACAQQLLKAHPEAVDTYLTTGFTEYLVGSLPFYVRWLVRFDDVKGSKDEGIRNLLRVAQSGQYLKSFAKVLLAIAYLREKQPQQSERLLSELARDYPENPLFRKELDRLTPKLQPSNGRE
jgi:predicted Zn-dependent protease